MEERDPRLYLNLILESCDRILDNLKGTDAERFKDDLNTQDAFMRRFEVIGGAVKRLPASIRTRYPDVAWAKAAEFRDVLAHDYLDIELDRLYDTAVNDLPAFRAPIARVLADLDREAA